MVGKVGSRGNMAVVMVDKVAQVLCVEFAVGGERWNLLQVLAVSELVGFG